MFVLIQCRFVSNIGIVDIKLVEAKGALSKKNVKRDSSIFMFTGVLKKALEFHAELTKCRPFDIEICLMKAAKLSHWQFRSVF